MNDMPSLSASMRERTESRDSIVPTRACLPTSRRKLSRPMPPNQSCHRREHISLVLAYQNRP